MSGFLFLPNTLGASADTCDSSGTTATGYDKLDVISGPRSAMHLVEPSTSHTIGYTLSGQSCSHAVLMRADLFKNSLNPTSVAIEKESTGWSTVSTTSVASMDLVGPYGQDWIKSLSENADGFRLSFASSSSQAHKYSKVFFSNAVDLGDEPDIDPAPKWEDIRETDRYYVPLGGYFPYETEKRITLTWRNLSKSTLNTFLSIPRLLEWPLVLYDENGFLWPWKAEHVLIEDYSALYKAPDKIDLEVKLRRLKHYDV